MADTLGLGIDLGSLASGAGTIVALVVGALVIIGIILGGYFLYLDKVKKYQQFKCIIWSRDGFGNPTQKTDGAGIFVDKDTQNKRFWMKNAKVGLSPDNVPYIQVGKDKLVYLIQVGLKNFRYIGLKELWDNPNYIKFTVGEEDVNWAINAYEKQKKLFGDNWLAQYLPFIILAFVCMIILILFVTLFNKFPLMKDMLQQMVEISKYLAQAKTGTTVIG
jgi:hypothetical protein